MIPTMPNTKAAGTEIYIINLTKVWIGLPHPGLSSSAVALAVIIPAISNAIAIFPKRIFHYLLTSK